MRFLLLICIITVAFSLQSRSDDGFYSIENITKIEIFFEQDNWDQLLDNLYAAGDEDRLVGSCIVDGESFDSVGVRYKGNSSYRSSNKKNPLNIKLDYIKGKQDIDGYETLKLSNGFKDPSFVREILGYEIARSYFPAPLSNYAEVYINDIFIGVFTNVQSVDKSFFETHYGSRDNPAFKGELEGKPQGGIKSLGYYGKDSADYKDFYEKRSDWGWIELINFLDILNNSPESIEEYCNVDRHLWKIAFDNLTVNLDGPINFAHNYYLYQADSKQFQIVPWDFNEAFGGFTQLLNGQPINTTGMQRLDPFLNENSEFYPIVKQFLLNPRYKKMYTAHMKTIIEDHFESGDYLTRALELQAIIEDKLTQDNNKFFQMDEFERNVNESSGGMGPKQIIGLKQLMDARVDYINTIEEFTAPQPEIIKIEHSPENPTQKDNISFLVIIENANYAFLGFRYNSYEKYTKIQLFDDGNHGDGGPNDGFFGTNINSSTNEIQYYIYAENDAAGRFDPARADYEYHTIEIEFVPEAEIVINELLAKNDNNIKDEAGELDDWIELYNLTNSPISLKGWFLSDEDDNPFKWEFPDVTIKAKDYLIIWADEDQEQGILHTNFKLSASGESLTLSNSNRETVDFVSWGEQEANISNGRYPNGTGSFYMMQPSPEAQNNVGINNIKNFLENFELGYYPNPCTDKLTIDFESQFASTGFLEIYNSTGQLVDKLKIDISLGQNSINYQPTNLSTGYHHFRLTYGSDNLNGSFVYLR